MAAGSGVHHIGQVVGVGDQLLGGVWGQLGIGEKSQLLETQALENFTDFLGTTLGHRSKK